MELSILTKREVEAHDTLIQLFSRLDKLSEASLEKVFRRWQMLHLMTDEELTAFRAQLTRVNKKG